MTAFIHQSLPLPNPFVIFTNNHGKIKEISQILGNAISYLDLHPIPINIEETGKSFEENALLKVNALSFLKHHIGIADDSGLEVNALQKRPGIYSARYAGPSATDQERCEKLLLELKDLPDRSAQFVCVIAIRLENGQNKIFKGILEGHISDTPLGKNGFGYDPIFIPKGFSKTMAELDPSIKNKISHRYLALIQAKHSFI